MMPRRRFLTLAAVAPTAVPVVDWFAPESRPFRVGEQLTIREVYQVQRNPRHFIVTADSAGREVVFRHQLPGRKVLTYKVEP